MTIEQCIIVDPYIKKNLSKNVFDSWMNYYRRGVNLEQFLGKTDRAYRSIQFSQSVDAALEHYRCRGPNYLILNWFGVFIQNFSEFHKNCIQLIESVNDNNWLFFGYIIDKEKQKNSDIYKNEFYPYPITSIVNVKKWREISCPKWDSQSCDRHVPQKSKDCIHDDYTPMFLEPTGAHSRTDRPLNQGENFITASLDAGLKIYNLPKNNRANVIHTYPESNPVEYSFLFEAFYDLPNIEEVNTLKLLQILMAKRNRQHTTHGNQGHFFLYNTESVFPPGSKEKALNYLSTADSIISPCSMFKSFLLGSYSGSIKNYIHIDIYSRVIQMKKQISSEWNGTLLGLKKTINSLDAGEGSIWNNLSEDIISSQFDTLLEHIESESSIASEWVKYGLKNHTYLNLNIITEHDRLIKNLSEIGSKKIYLAIGDIPSFGLNSINYGSHKLAKKLIQFFESISAAGMDAMVDIKSPISDKHILGTIDEASTIFTHEANHYEFPIEQNHL